MLRGAPKRNTEGTPLRVLSKHDSDLVPVRDEEAAGFRFCHRDHSSRSLTCGNAVSCARCSIPQRSPQRPRWKKWNAGATATGRRTPGRPARRSRPRGTAGSLQGTVFLRQQRSGLSGRDFRQPRITDDPKSASSPGSGPSPSAPSALIRLTRAPSTRMSGRASRPSAVQVAERRAASGRQLRRRSASNDRQWRILPRPRSIDAADPHVGRCPDAA